MKRPVLALIAAAALAFSAPAGALHDSISFTGALAARDTRGVIASYGGAVDSVAVKAGDVVAAGDEIARLRTTKVYAQLDGTVAACFAEPGDDADAATKRYGGVLYIEPTHKYTIYVDDQYAYESASAMYAHLGDDVYIRCVKDGSHVGEGVITDYEDGNYTVETTGGEFYPGEAVRVFNKARMNETDRIGRGTVLAADPQAVSATGFIARSHVKAGDTVEKGQLLLETVTDPETPDAFPGEVLTAPVAGIVTEVSVSAGGQIKTGGVAARICPLEDVCAAVSLTEDDLADLAVGDPVELSFETLSDEMRLAGTVSEILYLPDSALKTSTEDENSQSGSTDKSGTASSSGATSTGTSSAGQTSSGATSTGGAGKTTDESETTEDEAPAYTAYIDFDARSGMRLGLSVTVYNMAQADS